MRWSDALLTLPLAGALALSRHQDKKHEAATESKKFIVEVQNAADLDALTAKLNGHGTGTRILRTFRSNVFSGLSVESDSDNVDSLQEVAEVHRAWPMARINLAPVVVGPSFADDLSARNYSVHKYTGVETAHEAGLLGKGAVVAVVDTGVDYMHPALGGGLGPGFKVVGGYDLVGDETWPIEGKKKPDNDPMDIEGHGTHVSGIIAGKTKWFTGVAPEATLLSYKVFTQSGSTDEDTLIDAFLMAFAAGADVITASIGRAGGYSDGPWATVASRLVDQGVVVTIAAGNDGREGPFYASSGSSGRNVIAVASVDPSEVAASPFQATFSLSGSVNVTTLGYLTAADPWNVTGWPVVRLSLNGTNITAEACDPLPATTPRLAGAIVLVHRGGCNYAVKQANLAAHGAEYVLFHNNDSPIATPRGDVRGPVLAMIEKSAGDAIIATIRAGGNVTADFTAHPDWKVGIYNSAGGVPSEYTSWGGTYDLEIKPDVAAPGRNIYSADLNGRWIVLSGTSMSCPYVAGIAALYIGRFGGRKVHGPDFAKKLARRIVASGSAVPWQVQEPVGSPIDFGYWAPVPQVGTGMVDAWKVLQYNTSLGFEKMALNDSHHFNRHHEVHLTNEGPEPVTYKFGLQPAGGLYMQSQHPSFLANFLELNPVSIVPTVDLPKSVTVNPGETKKIEVHFEPVGGLEDERLPLYSGKILVSGSNGEELSIPYMGVAFNVKEQMSRNMFSDTTPYQIAGPNRDDIEYYSSYTFNASWPVQSFPKVQVELKWGTKELRWDIYEADWTERDWYYPPVPGRGGYVGSATFHSGSGTAWAFDPGAMDREDVIPFPARDVFRNTNWGWEEHSFWWMGKLANGSYIAPGNYTWRFAALVPFGDPAHSDNWDIWDTPVVTVLPLEI